MPNGDTFAHPISRRRAIVTLIVAFVTVMVGLAVIDAVIVRALRPQLQELSRIGDDHARAVSGMAQLREALARLRKRIAATGVHSARDFDPSREFAGLDGIVARVAKVCNTEFERAALSRLGSALERCRATAAAVEEASSSGERARAQAALEDFADAANDLGREADTIALFNATEVRDAAHEVRASLYRTILASTALAVLVLVAALVLLRTAVRAVSAHARVLEERAEELGAFAARAAHELRSPLQTLSLAIGSLRAKGERSVALDRADASARRLASTLQEIFEFSTSGGSVDPCARCDVSVVGAEVEQEIAALAAEAGVHVSFEVDGNVEVAMSGGHLRTLLSNLVINAVKYCGRPNGGRVLVKAGCQTTTVLITVHDDGDGIPPDVLAHVFEPFYRGSSKRDGYGLGLATVKRLVEAHGGHVTVTSEPAAGTTFSVQLPRSRAGAPQGIQELGSPSTSSQ